MTKNVLLAITRTILVVTCSTLFATLPYADGQSFAQTLGNPFGNPVKPPKPEKDIQNNDPFLEQERTHYCQTKTAICYLQERGLIGNPCSCESNGQYNKGRFIDKEKLH